jgi:hypothetical protein
MASRSVTPGPELSPSENAKDRIIKESVNQLYNELSPICLSDRIDLRLGHINRLCEQPLTFILNKDRKNT